MTTKRRHRSRRQQPQLPLLLASTVLLGPAVLGQDDPCLDSADHDRCIDSIGRYYQAKIYLKHDHTLHQPAFYTELDGCLDVRVMMSLDVLSNEELESGQLDDGWETMCRGNVQGMDHENRERTYMLPDHCESFFVPAYRSRYLYIGAKPATNDALCDESRNAMLDWASDCDCFLRWNGTRIRDDDLPWDQQPPPSFSKAKSGKGSAKTSSKTKTSSGKGSTGSVKTSSGKGSTGSVKTSSGKGSTGSVEAKASSGGGPYDCDDCKPASLRLKYIGGDCTQSTHPYGDKHECSGSVYGSTVTIKVTSKGESTFTNVPVGGVVLHNPGEDKLDSDTVVEVWGWGGSKQTLEIHTSCSAPLNYGDVFGSVKVLNWHDGDGNLCGPSYGDDDTVQAQGGVTGSTTTTTTTTTTTVAPVSSGGGGGFSGRGENGCSCGRPAVIRFKYKGGGCSESTYPDHDKHKCEGDYMSGNVDIEIDSKGKTEKANVAPWTYVVHTGDKSDEECDSDTKIKLTNDYWDKEQKLEIETKCDDVPLHYGDRFGAMKIVDWYTKDGKYCGPYDGFYFSDASDD